MVTAVALAAARASLVEGEPLLVSWFINAASLTVLTSNDCGFSGDCSLGRRSATIDDGDRSRAKGDASKMKARRWRW